MSLTPDTAYNAFTSSVACIGSTVCQMGMGDSQSLLTSCFKEMATQYAASDALPQIYISGCPSSCGTHQIGELGFRGTVKVIKGTAHPAFTMYINGCSLQGSEHLGEEAGTLLAEDIPFVLLEIGKHIAQSGLDFAAWQAANPQAIATIIAPYMKKSSCSANKRSTKNPSHMRRIFFVYFPRTAKTGFPTAHESIRLRLLPSGPDLVHRLPLRRTRLYDPTEKQAI